MAAKPPAPPAGGTGGTPASTIAGAPPAPGAGAEVEEDEDEISAEHQRIMQRTIDMYWMKQPQTFERKYLGKGKYKSKAVSRMPLVLRNLAPASAFNPAEKWEKEKERRMEAAKAKAEEEAEAKVAAKKGGGKNKKGGGGGGGGKNKGKSLSKADEIRARNKQDHANKDVSSTSTHDVSSQTTATSDSTDKKIIVYYIHKLIAHYSWIRTLSDWIMPLRP